MPKLRLTYKELGAVLPNVPRCVACSKRSKTKLRCEINEKGVIPKKASRDDSGGWNPQIPNEIGDGCLIVLAIFLLIGLAMGVSWVFARVFGQSKEPAEARPSPTPQELADSGRIWVELPVCRWHHWFGPGKIRIGKSLDDGITLAGMSKEFVSEFEGERMRSGGVVTHDDPKCIDTL